MSAYNNIWGTTSSFQGVQSVPKSSWEQQSRTRIYKNPWAQPIVDQTRPDKGTLTDDSFTQASNSFLRNLSLQDNLGTVNVDPVQTTSPKTHSLEKKHHKKKPILKDFPISQLTPEDESFILQTPNPQWSRRVLNYWKPRFEYYLKDKGAYILDNFVKPLLKGQIVNLNEFFIRRVWNDKRLRLPEDMFQELALMFAEEIDQDDISSHKLSIETVRSNPESINLWKKHEQDLWAYADVMPNDLRNFLYMGLRFK